MQSETIEFSGVGGVTLVADAWGDPDADPVLFMHGGGQTRHSWGGAARLLARRGWRTISVDLRGHGDSGWSSTADYEAETFVADINALLAVLPGKAVLVGASLGGRTATFVVGNGAPDLCRALVLVDITPKVETKGVERILNFMTKHPDGFATVEAAADAVAEYREHRSRPKDVNGLKKNLRLKGNGRWYWHWDPKFLDRSHPHDEEASRAISEAASRINIPTLLVRGGSSDVVSHENVQDFMRLVPHAEFVDVVEAGHMVAGDRNDAFSSGVVEFLDRIFSV
ncbi:MAG: Non-heme bromoperoxidase BPO-A2 [Alphaproteobacteria bacterium MarineAlpha4_Bin2]|nr:MAG: Non-heme bromoperoxidase BPO-A2 [Alphaproteobacteria bacterium MarineAlpha4_Bin2]